MGYGTPAPKVLESVERALQYNLKPANSERQSGPYVVNSPYWGESDNYPVTECHGNFHAKSARMMFTKFLSNYHSLIRTETEATIERMKTHNASVLTKGCQTWDPFSEKSIPCPLAYRRMERLMNENLGTRTMNCLDWLARYNQLKNLKKLVFLTSVPHIESKTGYCASRKMRVTRTIRKTKRVRRTIEGLNQQFGTNAREVLREAERSFCSYIKDGERAKLKRRAIASANVILRMYLHIIEDFHLNMGKTLPGSTISIGGEEKKAKITTSITSLETSAGNTKRTKCQATQDATKWNECLSADLFALFHMVIYNDGIREELNIPPCTTNEKI